MKVQLRKIVIVTVLLCDTLVERNINFWLREIIILFVLVVSIVFYHDNSTQTPRVTVIKHLWSSTVYT